MHIFALIKLSFYHLRPASSFPMADSRAFILNVFLSLLFSTISCQTQTYIVRVDSDLKPTEFPEVEDWYKSTIKTLPSTTKSTINSNPNLIHVYKSIFYGFSASLTVRQVEELKQLPHILAIFPEKIIQPLTTRSPRFLGLKNEAYDTSLLSQSDLGSNTIIGLLDSGIWPERRSFNDADLGPIPAHWKGKCDGGKNFPESLCNKKLIGARYFIDGYEAHLKNTNQSTEKVIHSARDFDGHGTHTSSTAAGRLVHNVSLLNHYARGTAHGVAPKARLAMYKVCLPDGCADSDILAGLNAAVEDGVDVISISLGSWFPEYYNDDVLAIGTFAAVAKGVFISCSAGNSGPDKSSVVNVAPWMTTVGAGKIDRLFRADLVLGDGRVFTGSSLYKGKHLPRNKFFPLVVYDGDNNANHSSVDLRGKLVVCDWRLNAVRMSLEVKKAGGAGVVMVDLAYPVGRIAYPYVHPGLMLTGTERDQLLEYLNTSSDPRATIVFHGTQVGVRPAPVLQVFSSRGPNVISPHVMKPDVIAPGVDILAAWVDGVSPSELPEDPRRTEFNIISGTSMACPHVSGVGSLLKGAHPDWSPAMIRSAMMTTAYTHHNGQRVLDEYGDHPATSWAIGSGHVDPVKAVDPGLVYDLTTDEYVNFLCASKYSSKDVSMIAHKTVDCKAVEKMNPWDLNYPAISVVFNESGPLKSEYEVVVTRTVTQINDAAASYYVSIVHPRGVTVIVEPEKIEFTGKGEKQSYVLRIVADAEERKGVHSTYGKLTWSDGNHYVHSPIVVTWRKEEEV